jgi:hypothetical protein
MNLRNGQNYNDILEKISLSFKNKMIHDMDSNLKEPLKNKNLKLASILMIFINIATIIVLTNIR